MYGYVIKWFLPRATIPSRHKERGTERRGRRERHGMGPEHSKLREETAAQGLLSQVRTGTRAVISTWMAQPQSGSL